MPVVIRGKVSSGKCLIYLHGGPGGSSFIDLQNNFFAEIEKHYAVVYYDQRASGNSQGNSSNDVLTLEQFVEDLDIIVHFTRQRLNNPSIFLMGHSWGGTLGTAYLLDSQRQEKICGWIEVNGGHNIGRGAFLHSKSYVQRFADSILRSIPPEKNAQYWRDAMRWYENTSTWRDPLDLLRHAEYVTQAGGYFFDVQNSQNLVGLQSIFFSETNFISLLAQNRHVVMNMDVWHYDFTPRLRSIQIPTLILWGKHDGILPLALAIEARDAMNLKPEQIYIFERSAHSPHYEETALFNTKVIDFLNNN